MYAVIETSGSQIKVADGQEILIDLVEGGEIEKGKKITFDKVLVVGAVGGSAKIGQPYVKGATVTGEVVDPFVKGEKLAIQKFRDKKTWKKKTGHRQKYTAVKITAITG